MWGWRDDRGQATPLLAAAVALTVALLLAFAPMVRGIVARTQARTAADAAALVAAAEDRTAAAAIAAANGGELVDYERRGDEVVVEVRVAGVTAFARARAVRPPPRPPSGIAAGAGVGARAGLAPAMLAALERADRLLGRAVPIVSGFRSSAQQQALWERRGSNPYPVARPGSSFHERGLAIDVPRGFVGELLTIAAESGLCQPLPASDPVHFEVCGVR